MVPNIYIVIGHVGFRIILLLSALTINYMEGQTVKRILLSTIDCSTKYDWCVLKCQDESAILTINHTDIVMHESILAGK